MERLMPYSIKIVRDSIIKIRWELKWFEEDPDAPEAVSPG